MKQDVIAGLIIVQDIVSMLLYMELIEKERNMLKKAAGKPSESL